MKILAVGAHPDDVALFCGGTLLRAVSGGHEVRTVVYTGGETRGENRLGEEEEANKFIGSVRVYMLGLYDGMVVHNAQLVTVIDQLIHDYQPDLVLSHSDHDHHQDHKAVFNTIKSANRNWAFNWLTYESYDVRSGFVPNVFVDITDFYERKLELLKIFKSQQDRWYFQPDVLNARSLGAKVGKYVERFRAEYFAI